MLALAKMSLTHLTQLMPLVTTKHGNVAVPYDPGHLVVSQGVTSEYTVLYNSSDNEES